MQTENYLIRKPSLEKLFNNLIGSGKTIYAPKAKGELALFDKVQDSEKLQKTTLLQQIPQSRSYFPAQRNCFPIIKRKRRQKLPMLQAVLSPMLFCGEPVLAMPQRLFH